MNFIILFTGAQKYNRVTLKDISVGLLVLTKQRSSKVPPPSGIFYKNIQSFYLANSMNINSKLEHTESTTPILDDFIKSRYCSFWYPTFFLPLASPENLERSTTLLEVPREKKFLIVEPFPNKKAYKNLSREERKHYKIRMQVKGASKGFSTLHAKRNLPLLRQTR